MTNIVSILGGAAVGALSFSILIYIGVLIVRKVYPESDDYLSAAKPILAEIDDRLDAILLEVDSNTIRKVNDIVGEVRQGLRMAGYELTIEEEDKVEKHVKAKLKREGDSPSPLTIDRKDGELSVNYKKDF